MYLQSICSAIPTNKVSAEEIFANCGSEVEFQKEKLGILERGILKKDEKGLDLAYEACSKLFTQGEIAKENIDLLVYVTQNPDYILPQNSALLQAKLELKENLASFDISLGCSGFVYALSVAKALMLSENYQNALLVTCDPYSKITNPADRDTASVFGDAATATWLSQEKISDAWNFKIAKGDFGTSGSKHLVAGGDHGPDIYMNGRAIFNFMMTKIKPSLDLCLAKNSYTYEDIDYFVFHQASKFLLRTLGQKLNLPENKVPIAIERTANTISSSIPLVLEKLASQEDLSQKKLCLCGFGVGLSWGTIIIESE